MILRDVREYRDVCELQELVAFQASQIREIESRVSGGAARPWADLICSDRNGTGMVCNPAKARPHE